MMCGGEGEREGSHEGRGRINSITYGYKKIDGENSLRGKRG
jgi:hypothetical protein